jgi:FkbM family methyltransferase
MSQIKFNYFDLGLYKGAELNWMIKNIFPSLGAVNYHAYGFEPCAQYFDFLTEKFGHHEKTTLYKNAISDKSEKIKLFYANNSGVGNSIYETKNNINRDKYELVDSIVFSDWVRKNIPDFEQAFNILKVNIEGAEWPLFKDLCETGLHKHIDIFCGQGHDVEKITDFAADGTVEKYYNLLKEHDIKLHRFSEWKPERNVDLVKLIKTTVIEKYYKA